MERVRVMLVDWNSASREPLALALRQAGYDVLELVWPAELYDYLAEPLESCGPVDLPELIIADLRTVTGGGVEAIRRLQRAGQGRPLILLTEREPSQPRLWPSHFAAARICTKSDPARVLQAAMSLVGPDGFPAAETARYRPASGSRED
jgi:CheY-like chemotaxis protein